MLKKASVGAKRARKTLRKEAYFESNMTMTQLGTDSLQTLREIRY